MLLLFSLAKHDSKFKIPEFSNELSLKNKTVANNYNNIKYSF